MVHKVLTGFAAYIAVWSALLVKAVTGIVSGGVIHGEGSSNSINMWHAIQVFLLTKNCISNQRIRGL